MKQIKDWVVFPGYRHKGGYVHFKNITIADIWNVFFPSTFYDKYRYLGGVPIKLEHTNSNEAVFNAIEPLVVYLDYLAKPKWCPRWVLRFLYLFGNDNSTVRMRNRTLRFALDRLTNGYRIVDYKTKWAPYDLRITVDGEKVFWLADAITDKFYKDGKREDLLAELNRINPARAEVCTGFSNRMLEDEIIRLTPSGRLAQ